MSVEDNASTTSIHQENWTNGSTSAPFEKQNTLPGGSRGGVVTKYFDPFIPANNKPNKSNFIDPLRRSRRSRIEFSNLIIPPWTTLAWECRACVHSMNTFYDSVSWPCRKAFKNKLFDTPLAASSYIMELSTFRVKKKLIF